MKTLGLLGGMTYHSTALYYTHINQHVNANQQRRGKPASSSAPLLLHSFDHAEVSTLFAAGEWAAVADRFVAAARHMMVRDPEGVTGAQGLAIACNLGHKAADEVAARCCGGPEMPLLHIADFAAAAVRRAGLARVGLLGTRAAMEDDFIRGRLEPLVEVLIPEEEDRAVVDHVIFSELGGGVVTEATRALVTNIIRKLVDRGAQGVVLACTDLLFVVRQEDVSVPIFETMELHAKGLADWITEE